MGRTNVVIDDELIGRAMKLYGFRTKREAVDYALRRLVGDADRYKGALALEGIGWEGALDDLRATRVPER